MAGSASDGDVYCFRDLGKDPHLATSRAELAIALSAVSQQPRILQHAPLEPNYGNVHCLLVGDPSLPPVVLIHGSPGSVDNWLTLLTTTKLLDHARVILVDRPGFGESTPGQHQSRLAQATAIQQAVRPHLQGQPAVFLGHSFGGPVIARIAMDHSDLVSGLVFAAASVDPELETVYWYQHFC